MTTQIPHFIDGKRTAGQSTRTADVFNPSTGAVQAKVPMPARPMSTRRWPRPPKPKRTGPRGIRSVGPG
jgi:hypothetical protein